MFDDDYAATDTAKRAASIRHALRNARMQMTVENAEIIVGSIVIVIDYDGAHRDGPSAVVGIPRQRGRIQIANGVDYPEQWCRPCVPMEPAVAAALDAAALLQRKT
jgi:hypothetical protein